MKRRKRKHAPMPQFRGNTVTRLHTQDARYPRGTPPFRFPPEQIVKRTSGRHIFKVLAWLLAGGGMCAIVAYALH